MTSTSKPLARTPLHDWHVEHGAHFVERNGRQVPMHYGDIESETVAAGNGVGLADLSAFPMLRVDGRTVPELALMLHADSSILKPGEVANFDCDGPTLVCRLTERCLFLIGPSLGGTAFTERFAGVSDAVITDVSMALAAITLVGPRGESLLRRLTALDVSIEGLPPGRCAETNIAAIHALLVRLPRSSIDEIRLYIAADVAEYVWEKLLHVGRDQGITPIGLGALSRLGVES